MGFQVGSGGPAGVTQAIEIPPTDEEEQVALLVSIPVSLAQIIERLTCNGRNIYLVTT